MYRMSMVQTLPPVPVALQEGIMCVYIQSYLKPSCWLNNASDDGRVKQMLCSGKFSNFRKTTVNYDFEIKGNVKVYIGISKMLDHF